MTDTQKILADKVDNVAETLRIYHELHENGTNIFDPEEEDLEKLEEHDLGAFDDYFLSINDPRRSNHFGFDLTFSLLVCCEGPNIHIVFESFNRAEIVGNWGGEIIRRDLGSDIAEMLFTLFFDFDA